MTTGLSLYTYMAAFIREVHFGATRANMHVRSPRRLVCIPALFDFCHTRLAATARVPTSAEEIIVDNQVINVIVECSFEGNSSVRAISPEHA
jgi:hypothetical protein